MKIKNRIKIVSQRKKVDKFRLEDNLIDTLMGVFYQDGGIAALAKASGLHRNTVGQLKKDWMASKDTRLALQRGIYKLQKKQAA